MLAEKLRPPLRSRLRVPFWTATEDFRAICERLGLAAMPLPHLLAGETQFGDGDAEWDAP
jgi:hypothetical protein